MCCRQRTDAALVLSGLIRLLPIKRNSQVPIDGNHRRLCPCGSSSSSTPIPSTSSSAAPTTVAPTTTPMTQMSLVGCAAAYAQCGGEGFSGPTCCASGNKCVYENPWYSQCQPCGAGEACTAPGDESLGCQDDSSWADSWGEGCAVYIANGYCAGGGYGPAWDPSWGPFSDYAVNGVDASMACCECGSSPGVQWESYGPNTACRLTSDLSYSVGFDHDSYSYQSLEECQSQCDGTTSCAVKSIEHR